MQVRPGELAFHGAPSTLVTRSKLRAAFFVHTHPERPTADISVASSVTQACRIAMRSMREHEGRQDRFRGGLVKGVARLRPEMPSIVRSYSAPFVPKHERPMEPSSKCGVHVMRIAASRPNHLPFASCGPPRSRALGPVRFRVPDVSPLVARPPSTRLLP